MYILQHKYYPIFLNKNLSVVLRKWKFEHLGHHHHHTIIIVIIIIIIIIVTTSPSSPPLLLHLVWWSQTCEAWGGLGDMAIQLVLENVEVVSAPPPLYLNFYCNVDQVDFLTIFSFKFLQLLLLDYWGYDKLLDYRGLPGAMTSC